MRCDDRPMPEALNAREQQVVGLVILGRTNREVANVLQISDKTVEWNLTKVYRKLAVRSRTELTAALATRAPRSGARPAAIPVARSRRAP